MSDLPDFVVPGGPVEAQWGNEVIAALRDALAVVEGMLPVGSVVMYGGSDEPTNWLLCRGQAVSTTTYSLLYARIGDNFSKGLAAPPAGTFRLPNMQARFPVGSNAGGSTAGSFWINGPGETAGTYDPVMPAHNHTVPDHFHTDKGHGQFAYDGAHGGADVPLHYLPRGSGTDIGGPRYYSWATTTGGADRSLTSGLTGGGSQIPPGVAFNFLIRAL